ncbi:MAG: phosphate signaling complex protein PhoU [Coriobacteriales bacterium]|jgi:phosphate transport system protein|nr:phosphate signaling complex protein PhoU [Coriobacteriales bacterium]
MSARMHFDEQLEQLNSDLLYMGSLIERALKGAAIALSGNDRRKATRVIESDDLINRMERDIETLCLRLLLQQQPVARDLRIISAALKMITDMERIGDQAGDICEIVLDAADVGRTLTLGDNDKLLALADATTVMVNGAIDAFVEHNEDYAREVIAKDSQINALFAAVRSELIELIRKDEDASELAIDRLMVAKYFERIGDHAQNIAEWVEYSLTGYYKGELLA